MQEKTHLIGVDNTWELTPTFDFVFCFNTSPETKKNQKQQQQQQKHIKLPQPFYPSRFIDRYQFGSHVMIPVEVVSN